MKYLLPFILLFSGLILRGQTQNEPLEGKISYITSQSVYVKFDNTSHINKGDTLFFQAGNELVPALVVWDISSISCVCTAISDLKLKVSDKVVHKTSQKKVAKKEEALPPIVPQPVVQAIDTTHYGKTDTSWAQKPGQKKATQQIHGSVQAASFTNWSNTSSTNSQGEKFTFSLNALNLGNTNLSAECYISYVLNNKQWNEVQNSVFNQLKIYNFAFNYQFGKKATLWAGRKINPKLSSMGTNDGLQYEMKFKPISFGIIAGFRPNYTDYGFNTNLFQFGAYLFNEYAGKKGYMQTTLAFINQTNSWKIDRRYAYFQHVNSLVKNLMFFGSVEVDLYEKTFNAPDSTYSSANSPKLSNLYLSLGYRIIRPLNISLSYSARKNVIYYETYKDFLDKLLNTQVLQGYSLQVNYNPINNLSVGATASYRFQQNDPKPTKNLYGYVSYSEIPGIKVSPTASVVILETAYLKGKIYSAGISKNLASGKLYMGLTYRYVDYHYYNTEIAPTYQNMGEFNLTWRIIQKLALSVYYEGTFEKANQFNRIYAQANWRF